MGTLKLEYKWNDDEVKAILLQHSLFEGFPKSLIEKVFKIGSCSFYNKGDLLLSEGTLNDSIYFLLEGQVEILLEGNLISKVKNVGSVIGEMSFISKDKCSTSVRLTCDGTFFAIEQKKLKTLIEGESLEHQMKLCKAFSMNLVAKLKTTNDDRKRRIDLLGEREQVRILIGKSKRKNLRELGIVLKGKGYSVDLVGTEEELVANWQLEKYNVIVFDDRFLEIFQKNCSIEDIKESKVILISSSDISTVASHYFKFPYIDSIAYKSEDSNETNVKNISSTIHKTVTAEVFGIDKYLLPETRKEFVDVTHSNRRTEYLTSMETYFDDLGIRGTFIERARLVGEEMLMNAIFDAPTDKNGKSLYNHVDRTESVELKPEEYAKFSYASDGIAVVLSIEDPFGALNRETLLKYINHCYEGNTESLNTNNKKKAGGGLGLYVMIETADYTIFNIKEGFKTQAIALFFLDRKMAEKFAGPSFGLFYI